MKCYEWIVDKIVWFVVALFCAVVGTIISWYLEVLLTEVIKL